MFTDNKGMRLNDERHRSIPWYNPMHLRRAASWDDRLEYSKYHYGVEREEGWVKYKLDCLTDRQRKKWSTKKIRKYLLQNFCHPDYVDKKIREIEIERFEFCVVNGLSPKKGRYVC
jgi:hypothetical protein